MGFLTDPSPPDIKLAICVTFHYVAERLGYLATLFANFPRLARKHAVTVVTNAEDEESRASILRLGVQFGLNLSLFVPRGLGHSYLLPWSHFDVMRERFADSSFTHFLYQEDDLLLREETVRYLLEGREILRGSGLLPAILRVEQKEPGGEWYSTDIEEAVALDKTSLVEDPTRTFGFVNLPSPYQAMYFLDREAMGEHLSGKSSHPDSGFWHVRERAAQGLTFSNIPKGFSSRYAVPFFVATKSVDPRCFAHHLPNNYATDSTSRMGKLRAAELLI